MKLGDADAEDTEHLSNMHPCPRECLYGGVVPTLVFVPSLSEGLGLGDYISHFLKAGAKTKYSAKPSIWNELPERCTVLQKKKGGRGWLTPASSTSSADQGPMCGQCSSEQSHCSLSEDLALHKHCKVLKSIQLLSCAISFNITCFREIDLN